MCSECPGWDGRGGVVLREEDVPNAALRMPLHRALASRVMDNIGRRSYSRSGAQPRMHNEPKDLGGDQPPLDTDNSGNARRALSVDPTDPTEPRDPVDEASEESFPASDPPSWQPLRSGSPVNDAEPVP